MCACVWVGVLIDLHLLNVVHYATSGSDPPESDPRHMTMCLRSITDHSGRPWQTMWLTVNS